VTKTRRELGRLPHVVCDVLQAQASDKRREVVEEKVEERDRRYRTTLDLVPIGINHIAPDGKILFANPRMEEILGYAPGELVNRNIKVGFSFPEDQESVQELLKLRAQLHTGEIQSFAKERRYRRKDGSTVWVGLTVTVMRDGEDKPLYDISAVMDISERKRAEAELRQSEARLRSMAELSSDAYWEQDDQYRFTSITENGPQWVRAHDVTRLLIGKRRWDVPYVNMTPSDWADHTATLEARKPFHDLELCRIKDGKQIWVSISGEPMFDEAGTFKGYRGVGRDITARKRAEQIQALEHAVNRALADADDERAAVEAAIHAVCETQGWECGRYFRWNEQAGALCLSDAWGIPTVAIEQFIEKSRALSYAPGVGLAGRVWQSMQPLWVPDLTVDPRSAKGAVVIEAGMRAAFVFPVTAEGKAIGILTFNSREIREPDEQMLQAVRVIGSQVGQFLRRKQAEEELRRFRAAMDVSADMIWLIDPVAMRVVDVNDTACRTLGYSREEVLALGPHEIVCKPRDELAEIYRRLIAGDMSEMTVEGWYRRKDGSLLPMESMRRVVRSGEGHVIVAVARDTTQRRRVEEELRRFRVALDNSADMIVLIDRATMRFVDVNSTVCSLLGYSREELLQMGPHDLVPESREQLERAYDQFIANPSNIKGMRSSYRCKDGSIIPFESTRRVLRSGDSYLIAAISRDIRERIASEAARKQAEETVRIQAQQQRLIAEFGQQALASADLSDVLHQAVELVLGSLKADFSAVLELDANGQRLTYIAAAGCPKEWVGRRVVPVKPGGHAAHILANSEPLIVDDHITEARFSISPLVQYGVRSSLQVHIPGAEQPFGVLSIHTLQPRRFTQDDASFLRSIANILAVAIKRKSAEDKLAHLAQFDTVTGLPNRHLLRDRLGQTVSQAQRNDWAVGLLFIDLDRFKAVNDTFGHAVGDKLLNQVGVRLKECVRTGDTVGRLSGDEFAVVLSDLAKADDAGLVSQKIVDALTLPFEIDSHQIYVSASIGIALYPGDGGDADALIKNADTAMYRAKEQGRASYQFYLPQMNERLMERLRLEAHLRGALLRKEFLLHYQPKVNLTTGVISGFEALLRWRHGEKLVSPADFIPILEDTGLIVPVGEWVLRTVCEQLREWGRQGLVARPVAVNLSARQFQNRNLPAVVAQVLSETQVSPDLLELELTESLLMSDAEEAVQMLHQLKSLGVRLSVDDFGTGYSSLAYLKRFPVDALKIDRAFIRDAISDPDDATITLTIISLAHSLKLKVIAEGVETEAQLGLLRLHGCDEMQGFYFARPLPIEDCTRALIEGRRLQNTQAETTAELPSLLLVDDDENDLALLERTLAPEGFRILTATSPLAGLDLLARHGADVVISDQRMPQMSGVEFLSNVRKLYPDAVRVVASVSDDVRTLTDAVNSAGIHKFLSKSWDADRLRAEVREAYQHRRSNALKAA
jgi:diguanylate cyclase (GGDEF)-like protein/PAS domain S-box-containing protein